MPYLDYAASAPLRAEALAAMLPLLEQAAANPSSQHRQGRAARAAVETAREQVAALVGAAPAEVVFTSGGTEADNLAVKGTVLARPAQDRHLVCSAVEHHAVLDAAAWAEADAGARVDLAPVDRLGRVELDWLAPLLQPGRTALVAVMAANNEVGTGQPVATVADLAHAAGALLLCDAVQAAGLPGVDMARDGVDLLALASHKLGGPTGVGALVVRSGTTLRPLLHGGGQERGLRSGTLPAAAIAGFGAAADAALADCQTDAAATLTTLRTRLLSGLQPLAPTSSSTATPPRRGPGCRGCCRCGSRGGGPRTCCCCWTATRSRARPGRHVPVGPSPRRTCWWPWGGTRPRRGRRSASASATARPRPTSTRPWPPSARPSRSWPRRAPDDRRRP